MTYHVFYYTPFNKHFYHFQEHNSTAWIRSGRVRGVRDTIERDRGDIASEGGENTAPSFWGEGGGNRHT